MKYSNELISIFNNVEHILDKKKSFNFSSTAGDMSIGEYVILYFNVQIDPNNILNSKILDCSFSAIGSAMIIISAEYLCRLVKHHSVSEALEQCNPENSIGFFVINSVEGKRHSFNFVLQAFYDIIAKITNYGYATS